MPGGSVQLQLPEGAAFAERSAPGHSKGGQSGEFLLAASPRADLQSGVPQVMLLPITGPAARSPGAGPGIRSLFRPPEMEKRT